MHMIGHWASHHKILEMFKNSRFVLNQACILQYSVLLPYPDLTLKSCRTVNPAELLAFQFEGKLHDCVAESLMFPKLWPDSASTPLHNPSLTYFVDGSCFKDHAGNNAAYAIVQNIKMDHFLLLKLKSVSSLAQLSYQN